jgi:hypothetical protein
MDKKAEWIVLFTMVIVHIIYDWAIPFVHKDFHALFASSWNFTLFGYIAFRLIDDALNNPIKVQRDVKWAIGSYFIYRTVLNGISFLQSFQLDGSWVRYKTITSNYYADGIIWIAILIVLIYIARKEIIKRRCRKAKTI